MLSWPRLEQFSRNCECLDKCCKMQQLNNSPHKARVIQTIYIRGNV
jgi:hypothetical protein